MPNQLASNSETVRSPLLDPSQRVTTNPPPPPPPTNPRFRVGTALPAGNTYMTATQYGPITAPASSQAYSAPTDAAQTEASLSRLAATGAQAAFSNLSNGSDGAGGPATTTRGSLTGGVIVGSSTTSGGQDTGTGKPNGALRAQGASTASTWAWMVGGPVGAAILGAFMLAI